MPGIILSVEQKREAQEIMSKLQLIIDNNHSSNDFTLEDRQLIQNAKAFLNKARKAGIISRRPDLVLGGTATLLFYIFGIMQYSLLFLKMNHMTSAKTEEEISPKIWLGLGITYLTALILFIPTSFRFMIEIVSMKKASLTPHEIFTPAAIRYRAMVRSAFDSAINMSSPSEIFIRVDKEACAVLAQLREIFGSVQVADDHLDARNTTRGLLARRNMP